MKGRNFSALIGFLIVAFGTGVARASFTYDVVFKVGSNASIDWFEIDNPSVGGMLQVIDSPLGTDQLNADAVDVADNHLIFADQTNFHGYSIDLTGIQLLVNAYTPVTVTDLGRGMGLYTTATYNKTDGNIYTRPQGTDNILRVNFTSAGKITTPTTVGTLTGPNLTNMTGGDLDFDSAGSIWLTGLDSGNTPYLWNFNPTTFQENSVVQTPYQYEGMTFDSTGTSMYAYDNTTDQYGIVNTTTGQFQTILATSKNMFGDGGDLGEAVETIVPDPNAVPLLAIPIIAGLIARRRPTPQSH